MKIIPIGKTHEALVDDQDYNDLIQFTWSLFRNKDRRTYYAVRQWREDRKTCIEYMHKRITGYKMTDHLDLNGLNNQRENLRECNYSQNSSNREKQRGNYTSKYKGVSWDKRKLKWHARIKYNKKTYFLGYFADEISAAKAYDVAAINYFGEFARPNFRFEAD